MPNATSAAMHVVNRGIVLHFCCTQNWLVARQLLWEAMIAYKHAI
jgi:hypothetical protein